MVQHITKKKNTAKDERGALRDFTILDTKNPRRPPRRPEPPPRRTGRPITFVLIRTI